MALSLTGCPTSSFQEICLFTKSMDAAGVSCQALTDPLDNVQVEPRTH
ncbi:hypothetical protein NHJ13051_005547 [Beauveria bassiana]